MKYKGIVLAGGAGTRLASHHLRHLEATASCIRQTDDLLSVVGIDAQWYSGNFSHLLKIYPHFKSCLVLNLASCWNMQYNHRLT